MESLRQSLFDEFYQWESLGRGEIIWSRPVEPEPPFIPFSHHGAFVESPEVLDDGTAPGFFGRITENLRGKNRTLPPPLPSDDPFEALSGVEPPDEISDYRSPEDLVEHKLLLPKEGKISEEEIQYFLNSLSECRFAVAFEILAAAGVIVLQFVSDKEDAVIVQRNVELHLPQVTAISEKETLSDLIQQLAPLQIISRDLALKREFMLPIRPQKGFSKDPYQGVLGAMSNLVDDELAVIQINFRNCRNSWSESIWRSVTTDDGTPFFEGGRDYLAGAKKKSQSPLFAVVIRLSAFAVSEERSREIARGIASSFEVYEEENGFVLADNDGRSDIWRKTDTALRLFRRSGMLLNSSELCSVLHFPGIEVNSPNLLRETKTSVPAPPDTFEQTDLLLGVNSYRGDANIVGLSASDRTRHMHVIGASGTGKSTFLLNSVLQDLQNGNGLCLLEPHGDLVEEVLKRLPENRIKDVVMFDPADEEFPVGFNMLSAQSDIEKNLLASDFVSIFRRLSSTWGDQMTAVLANAVLAFLESEKGGTLLDLRRFLVEHEFRTEYLESVTDTEVRYFWQFEFPLMKGISQSALALVTRLNTFLRHKLVRNMVAQKAENLNFGEIMDSGKIFLAPLAQGLIGEENSWLLGSLLVSKFYQAALARQAIAESERRPFSLMIDEAYNFTTGSMASILAGTRKYGLGLTLAHQDLSQFGQHDPSILNAILTNSHTRVCFRLGDQDARKLDEAFEHFGANDFRKLQIGEAIGRIGGSDCDFSLQAFAPPPDDVLNPEARQRAIEFSRERYGTPRAEVEEQIDRFVKEREERAKRAQSAPRKRAKSFQNPFTAEEERHRAPEKVPVSDPGGVEPSAEAENVAVPQEESPPETAKESKRSAARKKRGRGGERHKSVQEEIKVFANDLGLRATTEAELPSGGKIDVLLEGQEEKIAVEVAIGSSRAQEVQNIAKSIDAGIPSIVVVSDDEDHLNKIREAAEKSEIASSLDQVSFLKSEDLGDYFSALEARLASSETESRGFTVKTKFTPLSKREQKARSEKIHNTIAKHISKFKGGG